MTSIVCSVGTIPDSFLLIAEATRIQSRWLNGSISTVLTIEQVKTEAVHYSSSEEAVYWLNRVDNTIGKADLETRRKTVVARVTSSAADLKGIALDWMTGNIYYTYSSDEGVVAVLNNQGTYGAVIISGLNGPGSIALDPPSGYVFMNLIKYTSSLS